MEEILSYAEYFARKIIAQGDGLNSTIYIHLTTKKLFAFQYKSDDWKKEEFLKNLIIGFVRSVRKNGEFEAAVSCCEAWMSKVNKKGMEVLNQVMPPSLDPDRIEVVMVMVWNGSGQMSVKTFELHNEGNKKYLGKELMSDISNGGYQIKTWLDPAFQ